MGKRGPKPVPTKVLEIRGSWRGKQRARVEPRPSAMPERFEAPEWLSPEAKKVWVRVIRYLRPIGLMTKADVNAMARYCALFVRWRANQEFVEHYGETYTVKDKADKVMAIRLLPQAYLVITLSRELLQLEREFGMTPSARASIADLMQSGSEQPEPEGKGRFFDHAG